MSSSEYQPLRQTTRHEGKRFTAQTCRIAKHSWSVCVLITLLLASLALNAFTVLRSSSPFTLNTIPCETSYGISPPFSSLKSHGS